MNSNLETLNLTPEQQQLLNDGGQLQIWDGIPMVVEKPQLPPRRSKNKCGWVRYDYQEMMKLAKLSRNVLLAVIAELHRLHFQAWDKRAPIEFSNSALRPLGFGHHDKVRALKTLEKAGWVTVLWRKRKSPLVAIVQGILTHGR